MEFLDVIKTRYSVRDYENKEIEKEKLAKILEAAHVAPTAANLQPVRLIVVQGKEALQKLEKGANIFHAPLAILVCSNHNRAWKRPTDGKQTIDIDASILTDHMMLQATALGVGSLWVGYFDVDTLREEFNIPKEYEPINILALGYAKGTALSSNRYEKQRIPVEELVSYNSFQ